MNTLQTIKRVGTGLLLLSFGSVATSPVASFLGADQLPVQNVVETMKFVLIMVGVVIAFALVAIFGLGYLALTGWRDYKKFSKGLRLIVAFGLGVLIVAVSTPISLVLPIPFLPLVVSSLLIFGTLRALSNSFSTNENIDLEITEAITTSRNLIDTIEPHSQNKIEVVDSRIDKKCWKILLSSNNSGKRYEVQINRQNGDVMTWKFLR